MKNKPNGNASYVRATQLHVINFYDAKEERQVIMMYTLGEDGIVREFYNGAWHPYPITDLMMTKPLADSGK